jgi:hypothetical protein
MEQLLDAKEFRAAKQEAQMRYFAAGVLEKGEHDHLVERIDDFSGHHTRRGGARDLVKSCELNCCRFRRLAESPDAIVDGRHGIAIDGEGPQVAARADNRVALREILAQAVAGEDVEAGAVHAARPGGGTGCILVAMPLRRAGGQPAMLMVVPAARAELRLSAEDVARLYGRTPAEARMSTALANGHNLARFSAGEVISPNSTPSEHALHRLAAVQSIARLER